MNKINFDYLKSEQYYDWSFENWEQKTVINFPHVEDCILIASLFKKRVRFYV